MTELLAIVATRNEIRYIDRCISHLVDQGASVHVIDNGSTDGTVEVAQRWLGNGVVCIDHQPWTGAFELREQLRLKQLVAASSTADWFLHLDADELREPPSPYTTLVEAIGDVQRLGYNAVDFDEFVFVPTAEDPDFDGPDFVERMRWYYHFEPSSPDRRRTNLWKRIAHFDLVSHAGHSVDFPGRRVFPRPFVMRHYPVLSGAHAEQKYAGRAFAPSELAEQWHSDRAGFRRESVRLPRRADLNELSPNDADGREWFDPLPEWDRHPFLDPTAGPVITVPTPDPERERRVAALVAHAEQHRPHIPKIGAHSSEDRPVWSVMLPVRNPRPEHLAEALRSVLAQDPGRSVMEVVVVDDASHDGTAVADLVADIGSGRIAYHRNQQPHGLGGNWNECVRRAQGELVHLLHQDDRVAPGFYDRLGRAMRSDDSIVGAFCRVAGIDDHGSVTWTQRHEAASAGILASCVEREASEHVMIVAGVAIRRSAYETIGGYRCDLPYCADWDLLKRLSVLGPIWYEPEVLAFWRQHAGQETASLAATGADLADRRRSIALTEPLYSAARRAAITESAVRMSLRYAVDTLGRQLGLGLTDAALSQAKEIVSTLEQSGRTADPLTAMSAQLAAAEQRIAALEAQQKGWVAAIRLALQHHDRLPADDVPTP